MLSEVKSATNLILIYSPKELGKDGCILFGCRLLEN